MVAALSLVSSSADGLQSDGVVSAAGDASHGAVCVHGVTLGLPFGRGEGGDV